MVIIPGKCIYLCTPATGSRSTVKVLMEQCGGRWLNGTHHARIEHMPLLDDHEEPVYTTLRDPYDYVLSRYWYKHKTPEAKAKNSLESYIIKYSLENREGEYGHQFGSTIAMYRDYVDRFFLFEEGLKPIFDAIGFSGVELPEVGKPTPMQKLEWGPRLRKEDISQEAKDLIEKHFAEELALYRQVKSKRKAA
jgi:hypothetical protein